MSEMMKRTVVEKIFFLAFLCAEDVMKHWRGGRFLYFFARSDVMRVQPRGARLGDLFLGVVCFLRAGGTVVERKC